MQDINSSQNNLKNLSFAEILSLPAAEKEEHGLLHTPQEIFQQPATWRETFRIVKLQQENLNKFLRSVKSVGDSKFFVSLIGAGTSDYIGRALVGILRQTWKCRVEAVPSTDLLTEMDEFLADCPADTKHLWISFSRSGDSFEGVKVIEKAFEKYPQILHLVITCNKNGRMKKLCDENDRAFCLTLDEKVNDLGLAMTSSFTNMIVAGQSLANLENLDNYEKIIDTLANLAQENIFAISDRAREIAAQDFTRICFLGSGALKSVGAESALKVMELTAGNFSVMYESFLGLRHGPLSWLNQKSLVVAFLSNDSGKAKIEIDLIKELERKNAAKKILVIAPRDIANLKNNEKIILNIPEQIDDNYLPPLEVLFAQCLGLFSALRGGIKPDAPSADGKIQRVVANI